MKEELVLREQQQSAVQGYESDFAHLKSEIHLLEKNDFTMLKQETDRIASVCHLVQAQMGDELQKLQAGLKLDMNLDKGRIRDEQSALGQRVKDAEKQLERAIQELEETTEIVRWDTIRVIAGVVWTGNHWWILKQVLWDVWESSSLGIVDS